MNVLIIADYRTPKSGNFIASLLDLGTVMRKRENTVVYMFPDNNVGGYSWCNWLKENQFEVLLFDEKQSDEKQLEQLKIIIEKNKISIIHSHFGYLYLSIVADEP